MATIFLKNSYGGRVYLNPVVLSPLVSIVALVNFTGNVAWSVIVEK